MADFYDSNRLPGLGGARLGGLDTADLDGLLGSDRATSETATTGVRQLDFVALYVTNAGVDKDEAMAALQESETTTRVARWASDTLWPRTVLARRCSR